MTSLQYEKTACWQCKCRPVQVIAEMRRQHAITNPPLPYNERYGPPKSRKFICACFCTACILLVACVVAFYFTGIGNPGRRPVTQPPGKNATKLEMMPN